MESSHRSELVTDKTLRAWLRAGPVDRGIGDGLTFVASARGAAAGKASWVLRFRFAGAAKGKVLGRYPDLSLAQAREKARSDRALIQQGIDVAAAKRLAQLDARRAHRAKTAPRQKSVAPNTPLDVQAIDPAQATVGQLGQAWLDRYITPRYKQPDRIRAVLERHLYPTLGTTRVRDVVPLDVDRLLVATVARGAPTVANDLLRYLVRLFKYALILGWASGNPAASFGLRDAGGREHARTRWLALHELISLGRAMRSCERFGRENELATWLLLALCVRKMELLSARWSEFDFTRGVWFLRGGRTKTGAQIEVPLTAQVMAWLQELKIFAVGSPYVFPLRRRVRRRKGVSRQNRFPHVSPDTLNVALRRLDMDQVVHFTVHDLRRTARTHMAAMGVNQFVCERVALFLRDALGGGVKNA